MRFENWRNKFFLFKFLYKFLFLNKFSWWHPCLSILSLIKLVSSSENWGDLTLFCILGASANSILSPEIIDKMFGSFVSFLYCLTCFSSWPPLKLLTLLNSKDLKLTILFCIIASGVFALASKVRDLDLIGLSLKKSFVCNILCF